MRLMAWRALSNSPCLAALAVARTAEHIRVNDPAGRAPAAVLAGADGQCSPHHQTHVEASSLESQCIL